MSQDQDSAVRGAGEPIPLVTLGIPAYNRPHTLRRALQSVVLQDYPRLEVIVSDDCSPDQSLAGVVEEFRPLLPNLSYVRQRENLGLVSNAMWLLERASGEYFMWLADDDEISPNYVSRLAAILDENRSVVTAMGHWHTKPHPQTDVPMRTAHYPQPGALARAAAFIWRSDDAFFYGLHRTEVVREAEFGGFWPPNRGTFTNWCYVYIIDLVLRGQVALVDDPTVRWVGHNYAEKEYAATVAATEPIPHWAMRRFNVYQAYLAKSARFLGVTSLLVLVPVAAAALARESAHALVNELRRSRVASHRWARGRTS